MSNRYQQYRGWLGAGCVAAVTMIGAPAFAATLSGATFSAEEGTAVSGMEVRLWQQGPKGYAIVETTTSGAGGAYQFTEVATGTYKIDARMGDGVTGHYGDTWFDEVEPMSEGLFFSDADVLEVTEGDTLADLNVYLPQTGGFDGRITSPAGVGLQGIGVRAESLVDHRYHHNHFTKMQGPVSGAFSMRGLISTGDGHSYRLLVYDPLGRYETQVVEGPFSVTEGSAGALGNFPLVDMGADANEPNNEAAAGVAIDALPYSSEGAIIAPRGSDVDFYCVEVDPGDRLIARARALIEVDGQTREHPWVDPILSVWNPAGPTLLGSNDDDPNGGTLSSLLDTGELEGGRHCFVVSTFGDADWTGAGQQSAGRYVFDVEMGNRRPFIEVSFEDAPLPAEITVSEGDLVEFSMIYGDIDGDVLDVSVVHLDAHGEEVTGTLAPGDQGDVYTWDVAQTAAPDGPFELTFIVSDGEYTAEATVVVTVDQVNVAPGLPVLLSPIAGERVSINAVPLSWENAIDVDEDLLTYDVMVRENSTESEVGQDMTVDEGEGGQTEWRTEALTENALVYWRVRAFDGDAATGYGMWTDWETFRVDTTNEPPAVPEIRKPVSGELVLSLTPRISTTKPADPEDDPVAILMEIAGESSFDEVLVASGEVPAEDTAQAVEWTLTEELTGGQEYYVRARATDDRGAQSEWSDPLRFRVRAPDSLTAPVIDGEMGARCSGDFMMSEEGLLEALTVDNIDANGDALSFELEISRDDEVVFSSQTPQSEGAQTTIAIDEGTFSEPGTYLLRVRAIGGGEEGPWSECTPRIVADEEQPEEPDGPRVTITDQEDGCGCTSTSGSGQGSALALLLGWLLITRRRKRTA